MSSFAPRLVLGPGIDCLLIHHADQRAARGRPGGCADRVLRRCLCGGVVWVVSPVVGRPGLSERVQPFGWEEPGVSVGAHHDVPAVVVDDAMVHCAQEDQVR